MFLPPITRNLYLLFFKVKTSFFLQGCLCISIMVKMSKPSLLRSSRRSGFKIPTCIPGGTDQYENLTTASALHVTSP